MKEKAYMIPRKSRLFIAAAVCMSLQFVALAVVNAVSLNIHIPFFGNLFGDPFFGEPNGYFVIMLISDILYFLSCVLQVIGMLLARKNLWILSAGCICTLLLQLFYYFTGVGMGTVSFAVAACAALMLILVQTGNIRSQKAAVIPFVVCGAVYLAIDLPVLLHYQKAVLYLAVLNVLQPVSCALLMGAMLFRTDAVTLPKPIVEVKADEEQFPQ